MSGQKQNKYSWKKSNFFRKLRGTANTLLTLMVLAAVAAGVRHWVLNSEVFHISQVEVKGASIISSEDILSLFQGDKEGKDKRIFDIEIEPYKKKIEENPYVANVSLGRKFPRTIKIELQERIPVAYLVLDKVYLVDSEGYLLPKLKGMRNFADCPVITGVPVQDPVIGRKLNAEKLYDALSFLGDFEEILPDYKHDLSEIHFTNNGALTLFLSGNGVKIEFGHEEFRSKLIKLRYFLEYYENNSNSKTLTYINLNYKNQIVVKESG